jgi:hypothetical protein
MYEGFFQSAQFLAGHEDEVRRRFALRPRHRRAYRAVHGGLNGHVAVHVRRGDYAGFNGGALLPLDWYRECLARIDAAAERPTLFISDDMEFVREAFADVPGARFVASSEAVDLQVLTRADALVLSPSSFSWWGAWLNPRSPQVFVPHGWLNFRKGGDELPAGVVCPEWTTVAVA